MPVELPTWAVVALNVVGWPAIHFAVAAVAFKCPWRWFDSRDLSPTFSASRSTKVSKIDRWLRVRAWKGFLPDAARWFRGAMPRDINRRLDAAHVRRLVAETRRGEVAHWVMLFAFPVFAIWNPPWADCVMAAYALAANVPCILVQRFNRRRLVASKSLGRGSGRAYHGFAARGFPR